MAPRSLLAPGLAAFASAALCCALCVAPARALAQLELGGALRSLERHGAQTLPRALLGRPGERIAVLAEYPADSGLSELLVAGRYRPLWLAPSELSSFVADHPELKLHWAPPRHV